MKILNLYAGIGGNRKLWGDEYEVTAVENNKEIAKIYQDFFPNDKVVIDDAHKYLLEHFEEFDFIWSSPPCPTHSRLRKGMIGTRCGAKPIYPDMKLYEEIIFLKHYFKGKWVVENVIGYYEPLIRPYKISRHYYWSNFVLDKIKTNVARFSLTNGSNKETDKEQIKRLEKELGFDLSNYKVDKRLTLRNCVEPNVALHIFKMAFKIKQQVLSNSSPPVRTSNSTSLTSDKPKGFNMGDKVTPSASPKDASHPSHHPLLNSIRKSSSKRGNHNHG